MLYLLTFFIFFFFLIIKSVMKSGSVAIKGQFTVQKAALEDLSNFNKMLRRALSSFSPSFIFFCLVSLSRGSLVHLKHREESAWGREEGTPLPQQLVLVGMKMAAAGPSS